MKSLLVSVICSNQGHAGTFHSRLWWSVFRILGRLFRARSAQVPEDDPAVICTTRQDGGILWVPVDLVHHVTVTF